MIITNCQKCKELCRNRNNIVSGIGPDKAKIMIVGEAPGADEDIAGEPFVGRCGRLLDKMLIDADLDRKQIYITNAVKCRPPKNRPPLDEEIDNCGTYLWLEIKEVRPKVIITLGKTAARKLLKLKKSFTLGDYLGKEMYMEWPGLNTFIIPCLHPSYLLQYGKEKIEKTVEHFIKAKKYI